MFVTVLKKANVQKDKQECLSYRVIYFATTILMVRC
jgi:hypothetical protein